MWLFAIGGFFSIVEHKDDPDYLLVRARASEDIHRYWPKAAVQILSDADYLYRAKIPRAEVEQVILQIVKDIKYPSFKGANESQERYWRWYTRVDHVMREMQDSMEVENERDTHQSVR